MRKKFLLGCTVGIFFVVVWLGNTRSQFQESIPVAVRSSSKESMRSPSSQKSIENFNNEEVEVKDKWGTFLRLAGLNQKKIRTLKMLFEFHENMPKFNQENIKIRNNLLIVLNEDAPETMIAFIKAMDMVGPDDDSLRTFLLNVGMQLQVSDLEKSELIISRAKKRALFDNRNNINDNDLSILVAFSYLNSIEDENIRKNAIEEIYSIASPEDKNYQKLLRDYFETKF